MKCAVVTPVGPGHEYLALDAEESVELARATSHGAFAEILFIKVDDTRGETGRSAARNQGVALAHQAFAFVPGNPADAILGGMPERLYRFR